MPIHHTWIVNVFIELERNISQLILWGSITQMLKLEANYFVECSWILVHPVFAHDELQFCIFDRKMTEMIQYSYYLLSGIRWFWISMCPIADDFHLEHLTEMVAVKFLHYQFSLPSFVINIYFLYFQVCKYFISHQALDLLIYLCLLD